MGLLLYSVWAYFFTLLHLVLVEQFDSLSTSKSVNSFIHQNHCLDNSDNVVKIIICSILITMLSFPAVLSKAYRPLAFDGQMTGWKTQLMEVLFTWFKLNVGVISGNTKVPRNNYVIVGGDNGKLTLSV